MYKTILIELLWKYGWIKDCDLLSMFLPLIKKKKNLTNIFQNIIDLPVVPDWRGCVRLWGAKSIQRRSECIMIFHCNNWNNGKKNISLQTSLFSDDEWIWSTLKYHTEKKNLHYDQGWNFQKVRLLTIIKLVNSTQIKKIMFFFSFSIVRMLLLFHTNGYTKF